jgi:dCMP deaminase
LKAGARAWLSRCLPHKEEDMSDTPPPQTFDPFADPDDNARGMLGLCDAARAKSTDTSTKTGAAIVSSDGYVLSVRHNDLPEGVCDLPSRRQRPRKYSFWEHAERRAIYECAADGHATRGATMFSSHFPCADCARGIIESKIHEIVVNADLIDAPLVSRFFDSMRDAADMLVEAGVLVRAFSPSGRAPRGDGGVEPLCGPPTGAAAAALDGLSAAAGRAHDTACTVDGGGVVAMWKDGCGTVAARVSGDGAVEWGLFGDTVRFGEGSRAEFAEAAAEFIGAAAALPAPR